MTGIVVGFDGSDGARQALIWAVDEAGRRGVPLTVITVVPLRVVFGPANAPVPGVVDEEMLNAALSAARTAAGEAAAGRDVSVSVRAVAGAPAEELLDASAGADMVVVGSRGCGGFKRLLLGSVSSQVVHHAACPVVVIPSSSRA